MVLCRNIKKGLEMSSEIISLDLSLAQRGSECFSAVFVESDRKLCSFAALVRFASHLPCLLMGRDLFST